MTRVACIDIGTVTCRLAVAEVGDGRVTAMDKTSTICDLGEGLAATGRIAAASRERVVACVRDYVGAAASAGVAGACCTLTSAARDATNASELLRALAGLGLHPQVIPGHVEGTLTFAGVAADYPGTPIMVADSGGGSTELAVGTLGSNNAASAAFVESVDVGCRRVTERFLSAGDPDTATQLRDARQFARDLLTPAVARAHDALPRVSTLVACGGTVTSLVAMRDRLVPYDSARVHGATLTAQEVDELACRLARMSVAERATVPGLQAKRAPVILGGALIISELLAASGHTSLRVSEHDLLYGLALSAAAALTGAPAPVLWLPEMTPVE